MLCAQTSLCLGSHAAANPKLCHNTKPPQSGPRVSTAPGFAFCYPKGREGKGRENSEAQQLSRKFTSVILNTDTLYRMFCKPFVLLKCASSHSRVTIVQNT